MSKSLCECNECTKLKMFKLFGIKDKSTTPSINLQSDKKEYFLSRDNLVDTIRQKDLELAHIQQEIRIRKNR